MNTNTRDIILNHSSIMVYTLLRVFKLLVFSILIGSIFFDTFKSLFNQLLGFLIWVFFTTSLVVFLFHKKKWIFAIFFLFEYIFITLYLLYYNYFSQYPTISQIAHLGEGIKAIPTLKVVLNPFIFLVGLIDLPGILLILFDKKIPHQTSKNVLLLSLVFFLVLVILREINFIRNKVSFYHFLTNQSLYEARHLTGTIRKYGPFLTLFSTIYLAIEENKIVQLMDNGPEKHFVSKKSNPNIILIQVESLDSTVLGVSFNGNYITPFLASLRYKSIFAPVVVSYHFAAGGTTDADFSILNSIQASPHTSLYNLKTYTFPQSLPRLLKKHGYRCVAFHNNDGFYFARREVLHRIGFDEFKDRIDMNLPHVWWGAPDKEMFEFIKKIITNENQPFFYYIITMSSHGPFEHVSKHYKYTNSHFNRWYTDPIVKEYFNAISYVDSALREFVEFVRNYLTNTTIIIVGDHSSMVKGKNYPGSTLNIEGNRLEIVPFFLIPPRETNIKSKTIPYALSLLDIVPTILDIAGIESSIKTYGDSIFSIKTHFIPFLGTKIDRKELYTTFRVNILDKLQ
ncbi:MAG: LTA synthase family protein [Brevinematia bacterium]